jgi:hypothetical protein
MAELDHEIDRAADRLLTASENLMDLLAPKVQAMRNERERIDAQVQKAEQATKPVDVEAEVRRHRSSLDARGRAPKGQARTRELLRRMVSHIDLQFRTVKKGKRTECPFDHGTIVLNADPLFSCLVSRDDRN